MTYSTNLIARLMLGAAAISFAASPISANSVEDAMEDFFEDSGAAVNVTGPGAYEGQSAGYYTGGSVWARTPTMSVNPVNIQLPRASGGCGGIDLFGGSFSFINASEMVALFRATANNAIGFAFQLAVDSISAEIGGVMKDMTHRIQQLNEFNMNSCEQAQSLVSAAWPAMEGASSTICQTVGVGEGIFSDAARARHGCTTGGERSGVLSSGDPRTATVNSRNYTWHALRSRSGVSANYAEFLMTLVGTVIYVRPDSDDGEGQWRFENPASEELFTLLLSGSALGPIQIMDCDTIAAEGCLNPGTRTLSVAESRSFYRMVRTLMDGMGNAIRNNQPLTSDQISLLNTTNIPIYKILLVNEAAQQGVLSAGEIEQVAEVVAIDIMLRYLRASLQAVEDAQSLAETPAAPQMAEWRQQAQRVRQTLIAKEREIAGRIAVTEQIVDRAITVEQSIRNNLSPRMTSSLNFSRGIGFRRGL